MDTPLSKTLLPIMIKYVKNPDAIRYEVLSHDEAITKDLKVMDTAAFALARENKLTILVGSCHAPATIKGILQGTSPATRVTP
jgi:uridylate kinase